MKITCYYVRETGENGRLRLETIRKEEADQYSDKVFREEGIDCKVEPVEIEAQDFRPRRN
jgi:hypothetical protein